MDNSAPDAILLSPPEPPVPPPSPPPLPPVAAVPEVPAVSPVSQPIPPSPLPPPVPPPVAAVPEVSVISPVPSKKSGPFKKVLLAVLILIMILGSGLAAFYFSKRQILLQKAAPAEFKTFYFTPEDESYEAVFSYKWEYPKFIWRFDKLTTASGKVIVQRRFLHVGPTEEEVQRGGWLDQSLIEWSPGEALPSGEVVAPADSGCWFQLDSTVSVKLQYARTEDEENSINRSERALIEGCAQVPTIEATPTPTVLITATPTPTGGLTPTLTPAISVTPSVTPLATVTPTTALSVTPTVTPLPTSTNAPGQPSCEYLQADKNSGSIPLTVNFKGKGNDTTRIKSFKFTFGDGGLLEFPGSFSSSHVQQTSYVYSKPGTWIATLEVLDDGDHWQTREECKQTIVVSGSVASKPTVEPTPTEALLPQAGIKIPALGGILGGFLMLAIGLAIIF